MVPSHPKSPEDSCISIRESSSLLLPWIKGWVTLLQDEVRCKHSLGAGANWLVLQCHATTSVSELGQEPSKVLQISNQKGRGHGYLIGPRLCRLITPRANLAT